MAVETGRLEITTFLIEAAANLDAEASFVGGVTCLRAAVKQGHTQMAHYLMHISANVNSPAATQSGGLQLFKPS